MCILCDFVVGWCGGGAVAQSFAKQGVHSLDCVHSLNRVCAS